MLNGIPRILIVRLSAIGDVVRVLPALHCLRDALPDAQIDWVVEAKAADVLKGHPALDQVIVFERNGHLGQSAKAFLALCRRIRAGRYDIVLDFHGILKSGLITGASGAKDRYGFARPRSQEGSFLFTNHKTKLGDEVSNRIHENLQLCQALVPGRKSLEVTVHVPDFISEEIDAYYEETFHGDKLVVAMHVPVDRPEKQWPPEHFAALADLLLADGRFEVVLTWGPGQFEAIEDVLTFCRRHPHAAPEMADLKHYVALVKRADLYFGGDTGPMHIASAVGTPVVAVFGGTHPEQHAPLRQPYEILTANSNDKDKPGSPRLSAADALRAVDPEQAYDACIRIVSAL